jgi:biotin synthase
MTLEEKLTLLAAGGEAGLDREDLEEALRGAHPVDSMLFGAAASVLARTLGPGVYVRGIVEVSNSCRKNCLYCGLRSGNTGLHRYRIPLREVTDALEEGWDAGLRSFLLQSGESLGDEHIDLVRAILRWTGDHWGDRVRMVLSLGELSPATLDLLRKAGGHRYLLRIEASSRSLYGKLHPGDGLHGYNARIDCLKELKRSGWQTGSGVLIGVPWQTTGDLADDLEFLRDADIDMCGMGPYIEHEDTPLYAERSLAPPREDRVALTLRMLALFRLMMPDVNMSATTALQTLDPAGLEKGMQAGANVFMPNLTPMKYRLDYNLYQGKTAVPDRIGQVLARMSARCAAIGRRVELDEPGDPLHFTRRTPAGGGAVR